MLEWAGSVSRGIYFNANIVIILLTANNLYQTFCKVFLVHKTSDK